LFRSAQHFATQQLQSPDTNTLRNTVTIDLTLHEATSLVEFCHFGQFSSGKPLSVENLLNLIVAADELLCPKLIKFCVQQIMASDFARFVHTRDPNFNIGTVDNAFKIFSVCKMISPKFYATAKMNELMFCSLFCLLHNFNKFVTPEFNEAAFLAELISELHQLNLEN
jgi:hypothetical protein